MGNLHKGHMTLIDKAKSYDSHVSASIFINPLQFNDASDFNNYPKSLDDERRKVGAWMSTNKGVCVCVCV